MDAKPASSVANNSTIIICYFSQSFCRVIFAVLVTMTFKSVYSLYTSYHAVLSDSGLVLLTIFSLCVCARSK